MTPVIQNPPGELPSFVAALLDPAAHPHPTEGVDVVETHISWLLRTDEHVYKIKKPVNFGFLDFSTLDSRAFYCAEEVTLNRRLSPDVYLGVVEITQTPEGIRMGGSGRVVDYAVKMRRLPEGCWLGRLLEQGGADPALMERIAARIASFHRDAEGPRDPALGGWETVRSNCEENFAQTARYLGATLDPATHDVVRAYTRVFLDVRKPLFRRREEEGWIRDGHGDLHAAQICVRNGIDFIDCIEFNERFRFADTAADLAFLAMDIEYRGRPELARALVDAYVEASGDGGLRELLGFYTCYRAYTRGKVESLRVDQLAHGDAERGAAGDRARAYFRLARRHAFPPKPLLLIMTGLMGSGKSTLGAALAERLDGVLVRSDEVRKTLAGMTPQERQRVAWKAGIYSDAATRRTYDEMHRLAESALGEGRTVVLDGSYARHEWRKSAETIARSRGVPFWTVHAVCDEGIIERRLQDRERAGTGPSDGRLELRADQRAMFEPPGATRVIEVDTGRARPDVTYDALETLYRRYLEGRPGATEPWVPDQPSATG